MFRGCLAALVRHFTSTFTTNCCTGQFRVNDLKVVRKPTYRRYEVRFGPLKLQGYRVPTEPYPPGVFTREVPYRELL